MGAIQKLNPVVEWGIVVTAVTAAFINYPSQTTFSELTSFVSEQKEIINRSIKLKTDLKTKVASFLTDSNQILNDNCYLSILERSVYDCMFFLNFFPQNLPLPAVNCAEDGEIVLEWFLDNGKSAILSIEGDSHFGYTLLKNGKYVPGEKEGDINSMSMIPQDLFDYLEK